MRHLISIEDLERVRHRAHPRPRPLLHRGLRAPGQEGSRAARPARAEPLLRGQHPDALELRAGRQGAERRRHQLRLLRFQRREGRVAQGHRADAQRLPARPDRGAHPARRRRRPDRGLDDGRASSTPATASTSTRPRRCWTSTRCASDSARLDGANIWIVGDVMHSRVARSNVLAFTEARRAGDRLRAADPDPARHRGARLRGRLHARRPRGGRRRLRAADAARAHGGLLRPVACASTRPSTRSTAAASGSRQLLMHPGPVNRGVELAAEVIDSPAGADRPAGRRRRRSSAWRSSTSAWPAGSRPPRPRNRSPDGTLPPRDAPRRRPDPRRPRARPARRGRHRRRRARPRRASSPRSATSLADRGGEVLEGAGTPPLPGLRRPARAPAHAGPGAQGGPRLRHARRGRRRLRRRRRDAQHRPRRSTPRRCCARWSSRPAARRASPSASWPRSPAASTGEALTEMARAARGRRARLHRRRQAGGAARRCCRRRCSTSGSSAACSPCTRRTRRCRGAGVMHEGEVSARLGLAGIPSISESTMIARDAAIAEYEGGRIHIQHLSRGESVAAIHEAKARGVQITCEASPHHLTLTARGAARRSSTPAAR